MLLDSRFCHYNNSIRQVGEISSTDPIHGKQEQEQVANKERVPIEMSAAVLGIHVRKWHGNMEYSKSKMTIQNNPMGVGKPIY